MFPGAKVALNDYNGTLLHKRINDEKDVLYFKTRSPAYKNIVTYVDLLSELIQGSGGKVLNHRYKIRNELFRECSEFLETLGRCSEETDLQLARSAGSLRFGHIAFRDWFDRMKELAKEFISKLTKNKNEQLKEELTTYLTESFGNRMRIDYGTGHELSFIIFTMGLSNLVESPNGDTTSSPELSSKEKLESFVRTHGWDIHSLFAHKYLRLCRQVQIKFRLEPAGSRGVYNMDDFQFLPFLFGTAQLSGLKYISSKEFYLPEQVELYKDDYIFYEAVDFILMNKRGPFNEHSYTLWGLSSLGSWDNIYRRIRVKFNDDILGPFPIVQHFLFGDYVLKWD